MSTQGANATLSEFVDDGREFTTRDWVDSHLDISVDEFAQLDTGRQRHILWELSREVPFKYAKHAHHGKMRRYLAGGVVPRCRAPAILYATLPNIREFRQNSGRAYYEFNGHKASIFVDFATRSAASEYGVVESDLAHELMHAILRTNGYRLDREAYTRDGRTDRAWYYNGGYPNWDFGGDDRPADTYFLRDTNCESNIVGDQHEFDAIVARRLDTYDESGLVSGPDADHAPTARPDPFEDVAAYEEAESDHARLRELVRESNLAWYTTAKAFSRGYEEFALHAVFKDEYTATNPDEFLCVLHEFLQSPGNYSGTTATLAEVRERHPWLLKRYLDVYAPHPDKQQNLSMLNGIENV